MPALDGSKNSKKTVRPGRDKLGERADSLQFNLLHRYPTNHIKRARYAPSFGGFGGPGRGPMPMSRGINAICQCSYQQILLILIDVVIWMFAK